MQIKTVWIPDTEHPSIVQETLPYGPVTIGCGPKVPPSLQAFTYPAQDPVIPEGWISKPGRTSGSTIFYPPDMDPSAQQSTYIRVMPPQKEGKK